MNLTPQDIEVLPYKSAFPTIPTTPPSTFSEFIDTLPIWEKQLIQHVHFHQDIFAFVQTIQHHGHAYITSDGSAPIFIGTFGWMCSLKHGERIAYNSGPACGLRTSSFRTEAYGLLSFLCLLQRALEYTSTHLSSQLHIFTDSESLLKVLTKMSEWPYYYPNLTITSDWDVLQAIVTKLQTLPTTPSLRYVRGHQDDHTPYDQLPLPAQLNVDADKLAGEYQYSPRQNPTIVPLITGNTVQIQLPSGTITSKLKSNLRKASSYSSMKAHIQKANKWSDTEFDSVNWQSHGMSIRKHYSNKRFLVKLVHDWLPVGALLSKYKPSYISKCPSCDEPVEDLSHFLRCQARPTWKTEMLLELQTFFTKIPTRPALADILHEGISSWLSNIQPNFTTTSSLYHKLIRDQFRIGWKQIFLGRFVKEWCSLQEDYLSTLNSSKTNYSGTTWCTGVIDILWKYIRNNWDDRNAAQHGDDPITREIALYSQAQRETEHIYALKSKVLPRDITLFYESLQTHWDTETTSTGLHQWLST